MRAKLGLAALLFSVLFWAPGGPAAQMASGRMQPLQHALLQPASVTVSPETPVVVTPTTSVNNNHGWTGSRAVTTAPDLTAAVLAAYTLAVAVSPPSCHITTPLLAAIGQVESGNLAGHTLDAGHRVVPEILGPVLDGNGYRAVPDTDGGQWDHNTQWDRALGPMQIIPSTWRVVGVDMDGDGVRDPQNIYDSAGAAMVYLCAGRDLGTAAGLEQAILSYNHSRAYLNAVLAWKAVFERADLSGTGAVPFISAMQMPLSTQVPGASAPAAQPPPTTATAPDPRPSASGPLAPTEPAATRPVTPASPATPVAPTTPAAPATPAAPTTPPSGSPSPKPTHDPAPSPDPAPKPDPTPLPECPLPTPDPTPAPAQGAPSPPPTDQPVVSPETCTPPDGWMFDPDTGDLVPVPPTSPAPAPTPAP